MPNIVIPEEDKIKVAPELLEVANAYLQYGDMEVTASQLNLGRPQVTAILNKPEIKRYIDAVFLEQGYRNRFKLAEALDEILESKLEEARESEFYSKKDLLEIIQAAHKMRMDHHKADQDSGPKVQTNVQINNNDQGLGLDGNYGKLMEALVGKPRDV